MNNYQLEQIINKKLKNHLFYDNIPNGLQIEGTNNIKKIITGVSICQKLIDIAIEEQSQAIIVHHGFFWKNECLKILKNKKNRLKSILINNINVYNWHLPLDVHPKLGNNAQIAKKLHIHILGKISDIVLWGQFASAVTVQELTKTIQKKFKKTPLVFEHNQNNLISTIAWCSGKGQEFIKSLQNIKIDAFLTGEASEDTMHYANENNIHFFSLGHYTTECDGVKALGKWLMKKYHLHTKFVYINNPV
ncbi:Nif3-like dinuclear metal center hexameric protein [Buchnera aphidicola]|uniref:GTP cyclohydrolase 1 type 2 homolog n=1 Tax=Buchnera aphidicola (Sarucallis kahawaluokalani) TaxID=1241878 RepID=A0A4D6YJX1_9GAMM|nr:Nif3-like dinuclear metal center hexameric protein [Buchnera aphidicola]QCI25998.1 Nif3-like dinuclear metal center hexameric protein [Buchnera aphidicola (Sarucallis kahawaluokalani)]